MPADDILSGAEAIATALGLTRRRVYHEVAKGRLPAFRIGATVCARRTAVLAWLAACEATPAAAEAPRPSPPIAGRAWSTA